MFSRKKLKSFLQSLTYHYELSCYVDYELRLYICVCIVYMHMYTHIYIYLCSFNSSVNNILWNAFVFSLGIRTNPTHFQYKFFIFYIIVNSVDTVYIYAYINSIMRVYACMYAYMCVCADVSESMCNIQLISNINSSSFT